MIIEKKLIKKYSKFNLYGIYKDKKLIYKTCESNIMEKLEYANDKLGLKVKGSDKNE